MTDSPRRAFRWEGRRTNVSADVNEELALHFELCVRELVEGGQSEAAARAEARRRFGDVERTRGELERLDRERLRQERHSEWRGAVMQDVRYALRALRRQPGFAAVVVLTLALAIGGNATIFSAVRGVLLRPLPYPAPGELMTLWTDNRRQGWPRDVSSYPNFADWQAQSTSFRAMAAYSGTPLTLTGIGEPTQLRGVQATPSLFDVLGVPAALGRTLQAADFGGEERVAVLADGVWQREFGADPAIVGRSVLLNGNPYRVVGVMPAGFAFPTEESAVWVPMARSVTDSQRGMYWLEVVARLAPGVSAERASAELNGIARRLETEYPDANAELGVTVVPLHAYLVGDVRTALLVLMAAVAFVLLIACANVANLVMVRAAGRTRELALRAALGAGRRRLLLQLGVESVCLALVGGTLGLALAFAGVQLFARLAPANLPRSGDVRVDGMVVLFTLGVSLLTALVFGLPYALHAPAARLSDALRDGQRGSATRGVGVRQVLVVGQLALALALLAGAGLLLSSFRRLHAMDAGFRPEGVLAASLVLPPSRYGEPERRFAFHQELLARTAALPGVQHVGLASNLPLSGGETGGPVTVAGRDPIPGVDEKEVRWTMASPDYFAAAGMQLLRGRAFAPAERGSDSTGVAVINESMARQHFPGVDPIGRRLKRGGIDSPDPWYTVVGIVADARQSVLDAPIRPELFLSTQQWPTPRVSLLVRTDGDPARLAAPIRAVLRDLDGELALSSMQPMVDMWDRSLAARRFNALLLGALSAIALALAVVGIYGVMSYAVAARRQEVGIRMAIGAQPAQVVRLVLRDALVMTATGLAAGLALSLATSRLIDSLLFDTRATDPRLLGATMLLLGVTALVAGYLPARRAARVDPLEALRRD